MMEMEKAVTRSSRFLAVGGVVAIAFGIAVLVWPNISAVVLLALFGAFALVFGLSLVGAGLDHLAHRSTDWVPYVLAGVVGMAIGAGTFLRPGIAAVALLYMIAAWAIVTGLFQIVAAVDSAGAASNRWLLAIAGLISIVFGVLLATWPVAGILAVVLLIGIYSIVFGVTLVMYAIRAHNLQSRMRRLMYDRGTRSQGRGQALDT
jgi:uncharacterized membrane protein HdeD (DUF308 family)